MSYDLSVFNLIRYLIAFIAIVIFILSGFTFFGFISEERTVTWVMIALPFILTLMLLGQFWLAKLKRWHIITISSGYWGLIVSLMFYLSGFEIYRTYIIKHTENPGVKADISEVFRYHLKRLDADSITNTLLSSPGETRFLRRGLYHQEIDYSDTLDAILSYKAVTFPEAEIVISDYDDKQMYEFSNLSPGDVIQTKISWENRSLKIRTSGTFFTARKECLINIPIEINNPDIYVDPQKDPDFTLKRLSFWAEKFTREEYEIVRKNMIVRHELRYKPRQKNEFFKYLVYDRAGELFLPIAGLKIDFLPMDNCSNSDFMLAKILKHNKNPYLIRLMFPALAENMKSWHFEDQTVFVGFNRMVNDFPRDFKPNFNRIF